MTYVWRNVGTSDGRAHGGDNPKQGRGDARADAERFFDHSGLFSLARHINGVK